MPARRGGQGSNPCWDHQQSATRSRGPGAPSWRSPFGRPRPSEAPRQRQAGRCGPTGNQEAALGRDARRGGGGGPPSEDRPGRRGAGCRRQPLRRLLPPRPALSVVRERASRYARRGSGGNCVERPDERDLCWPGAGSSRGGEPRWLAPRRVRDGRGGSAAHLPGANWGVMVRCLSEVGLARFERSDHDGAIPASRRAKCASGGRIEKLGRFGPVQERDKGAISDR